MRLLTCALALNLWVAPTFAQIALDPYLALGDSIPFGLDVTLLAPGKPLPKPNQFTGYPEIMKDFSLRIRTLVNPSCPGETSASFLDTAAPDNGCNHPHLQPGQNPPELPPFKTTIGLRVPYTGSQAQFAVSHLLANRNTKLVTLSMGGNDLLLLQLRCSTEANPLTCIQTRLVTEVLPAYGANLARILAAIRIQGQYSGNLVLLNYHTPSTDPLETQAVAALNTVMAQVGAQFGAKIADGFKAFQLASFFFRGDPCKAGLLVRLSPTVCDVHPSKYGQQILAAATLLAATKN